MGSQKWSRAKSTRRTGSEKDLSDETIKLLVLLSAYYKFRKEKTI
jgi:hypothetical protein